MDRRRLSVCANFVGYTDAMGHINQPNVSIECQQSNCLLDDIMREKIVFSFE